VDPAAQRGDVAPLPGGLQATFRCGTKGHGSVGNIADRWTVGLADLGGLFQP